MPEPPPTRYTTTVDGTYLAYQVSGEGPDLVLPVTGSAAVELVWEEPAFSGFLARLASFSRVVTFDPRGFGSSEGLDPAAIPAVQAWKDDILAVMDAAGSTRASILSWGEASPASMFFAATCPGRTASLVLVHVAELGDLRWRGVLDEHHAVVRRTLEQFRGDEVNTTGDGFFATFDGPARALQCACAIRDELARRGIAIRAGVHTGEVERHGGSDLTGIAVHIGARVAATAGPGEVLASRTVRDLVAGSGIAFADRGDHHLKGVPDTWRLFAVGG